MSVGASRVDGVVTVSGIPGDVPERVAAVARSRMYTVYSELAAHTEGGRDLVVTVGPADPSEGSRAGDGPRAGGGRAAGGGRPAGTGRTWGTAGRGRGPDGRDEEASIEQRAAQYEARQPQFSFAQLVLPPAVSEGLITAVEAIRLRSKIYDEWGLRLIEPAPSVALNLHGPPGTGKTLAAHAMAARLGMPIILAGYAELESKFHGDGPKNVKAAFHAAARQHALLFIDEADSLLSRRLTNVTQGSEQAINSMRSQIVLCLDQFDGVVVFSTNLVANYDRAFESRVRHFHFPMPDADTRLAIWQTLLVPKLPRSAAVTAAELARISDGFSGRDIKLAIVGAAERAALAGRGELELPDFVAAVEQIRTARDKLRDGELPAAGTVRAATPQERAAIEAQLDEHTGGDDSDGRPSAA